MLYINIFIAAVLLIVLAETTILLRNHTRGSGRNRRMLLIDTSALIDGRLIDVARSGFISDVVTIPRSVLIELQFLADNADSDKRSRARHGLDIVKELQDINHVDVNILQDGGRAEEGVDERLIALAKRYEAAICTLDFNLSKVAEVEGITVCNINDLSKNLRMAYMPGEKASIELVQKGNDAGQAVGYLGDGTMVVVEQAASQIGKSVEVEFTRSLQTSAGRMMFAKKANGGVTKSSHPASVQKPAKAKVIGKKPNNRTNNPRPTPATKSSVTKQANSSTRPNNYRHNRNKKSHEDSLIDLVDSQKD